MVGQRRSRIGGTLAGLALFLLIVAAFGVGYEQLARRRERERLPQIGRSVNIGGRALNISCSGHGSPTVVLESDALTPGYSWLVVQRGLATTTQTCWYDRAGYGWSDPAPAPRSGNIAARDLHALLRAASLDPPYLLVGDGFGAFDVRLYSSLYPSEVAGIVLVNPIEESGERMGVAGRVPFHLGYPPDLVLRVADNVGLFRLTHRARLAAQPPTGWSPSEWATLSGLARQPKMRAAFMAEQGFSSTLEEVRAARSLGDRPLVVLAAVAPLEPSSDPAEAGAQLRDREAAQSRVASLSTHGHVLLVRDSPRNLVFSAPATVIQAVQDLIAEIRGAKSKN